jgi:hypothetical protein
MMYLREDEIEKCLRDKGSLDEGTLRLEHLFTVTQHELEEIQDLLMLREDKDTTPPRPAEAEAEEDSETETEPLSVFLNENWRSMDNRQPSCLKGSRSINGWLVAVYVEDEIFLMTKDTGSTMTMIDTKAFFKRFLHTRLRPPQGAFQTADGSEMKITGEAIVHVEVGPVVVEKLRVAVTDLPVEGLLGIDFLMSADTFIGVWNGELIMKFEGREVRYSLRPEELPLNYIVDPQKRQWSNRCPDVW